MTRALLRGRVGYALGVATGGFLLSVVVALSLLLTQQHELKQGSYDETGIAAIQLRIHFEALMGALTAGGADGRSVADPSNAALQFDILYERLRTLPNRPGYSEILDDALLSDLSEIGLAFEREASLVDRASAGDVLALSGMRARLEPWRPAIERIAHRPVQIASENREAARASMRRLSHWLIGVVAMFVIAGLGFVGVIWRQMREAENRELRLRDSRDALHQAREILKEALDGMSEGFALWDKRNRLVTCNARYRDFYASLEDQLKPGVAFEEFSRAVAERGVHLADPEDRETELDRWGRRRRASEAHFEQRLSDGRWLEVNERRTPSGNTVATLSDITEKVRSSETIRRLAQEDPLTGLPNRTTFQRRLQESLENARRSGGKVGVMLLDLDRFKTVNDTLGHAAGDALLEAVATRLRECLRATDVVARLGGDEFGVVATHPEDAADVAIVARRIGETLARPFRVEGSDVYSGASIGVAVFADGDPGDFRQLLRDADLALYQAKADGRGAWRLFDDAIHSAVQAQAALERDLQQAIARDQLQMHYQPQIDVRTGEIIGAEALIRWRHPERGWVSPAEFIPIAERSRLIIDIGQWVLRRVARQCAEWRARGLRAPTVAVNISPAQLKQAGFAATVEATLAANALPAGQIELEITEGLAMEVCDQTLGVVESLKAFGARLAIDDFGSGFSSLGRLKALPADRLKIDRAFIKNLAEEGRDASICSAVIQLAHGLGLEVVAEGVETSAQLDILREMRCDVIQGFLISPALAPDAYEAAFLAAPRPLALAAGA